jgi:hypothetical protein
LVMVVGDIPIMDSSCTCCWAFDFFWAFNFAWADNPKIKTEWKIKKDTCSMNTRGMVLCTPHRI